MAEQEKKHEAEAHNKEEGHKKHKKHHPHRHEEHEHEEGWIVSFADNVLLMMGFFVIMLAMNMGPKGVLVTSPEAEDRIADLAIAVRAGFNNPLDMTSTKPEDQALIRRMRQRITDGPLSTPGPEGKDTSPQTIRPTNFHGSDGLVEFEQGASEINEFGHRTLKQLAERIKGKRWMVEIRGHTSRFETWRDAQKSRDLSYKRAYAVGEALVGLGVKWDQLRLVSSGDAASAVGRTRAAEDARTNQRAEVLILKEAMPEDVYMQP
jgi:flagellar motor protein MotB